MAVRCGNFGVQGSPEDKPGTAVDSLLFEVIKTQPAKGASSQTLARDLSALFSRYSASALMLHSFPYRSSERTGDSDKPQTPQDKGSVIHFKDAILPASDGESELSDVSERFQVMTKHCTSYAGSKQSRW